MEKNAGRKKQRGSFLLITMIVMLVMVFSGLFVMEMSMLEEITVSNEQRTVEVYQVAYSELESQLTFLEANPINFHNALSGDQEILNVCGVIGTICQTVTLRYISDTAPPAGYAFGKFISRVYELDSVATIAGSGARSSQTLGIVFVTSVSGG